VGLDRELEADVFEELATSHQLEFLETRSDVDAARLLSRMAADNAADLISEIDQERRLSVLEKLPEPQQSKVRHLLAFNADTAGGLMTTDFCALPASATVADALDAIRTSHAPSESLEMVFLLDESNHPVASVSIVDLVRARQGELAIASARAKMAFVGPHWDIHRVARTMADFNLTVVPVVADDGGAMVGVVTVDDLLEDLLPQGWRREFGMSTVTE
jgi:Mg/Co/Ni transporter MgtE